jgi:hypothetical protein
MNPFLGRTLLFHTVLWHGKPGTTSLTGYSSDDPDVIGDQLSAMANLANVWGCDFGVVGLTYGPTVSPFIHDASMEMSKQCSDRNIPFALCYDPWTCSLNGVKFTAQADKNAAMIAALKHPDTQTMLNRRSYLPGKPIMDFATGADKNTVLASVPGIQYWQDGIDFSWIKFPTPVPSIQKDNAQASMKVPAVFPSFDDGTGPDRNKSAWDQTKPARIAPPRAGNLFWDFVDSVHSSDYAQMVWNDVNENEVSLEMFASMLWGRIG